MAAVLQVRQLWVYQVNSVQDADAQSHEGFGEIDHLLSLRRDGEAGHGQVSFLWGRGLIIQVDSSSPASFLLS